MDKKNVTKTINTIIYIANDGKEFDSEDECDYYEKEKHQEGLEKKVDDKLRVYTKADFPSMIDISNKHEYRLFLIQNENDLDLFINAYKYWFNKLENYWQVNKEVFVYPDVLCVLDFPTGGDTQRLYRLSHLSYRFASFISEIDEQCSERIDK